jgi:hypothetical protein
VAVLPLDEPLPEELLLEPEPDPLDEVLPDELPLDELPLDELATARLAPQSVALPPPVASQIQVHGPEPDTGEAVPDLHRLEVGAALTVELLAEPQIPLAAVDACRDAAHCAVAPPPDPAQLQVNGPLPVTSDAVPDVHRLPVGKLVTLVPLTEPHAPLIATTTTPELEPLLDVLPEKLPELEVPVTPPPDELVLLPDELPLAVLPDELPELLPATPELEPDELEPVTPELELMVVPPLDDVLPEVLPPDELPLGVLTEGLPELPVTPELELPVAPLLDEVLLELEFVLPLLLEEVLPLELDPVTPELEPLEELPP